MKETLWKRFWRMIALFAWRRWWTPPDREPVGLPGRRDPEHPCEFYSPGGSPADHRRPRSLVVLHQCAGDGHYLCRQCFYLREEADEEAS